HIARREVDRGIDVAQLLAKTVLAELVVRRGDVDADDRLNDLAAQAERADELQRVVPVFELATEWALTSGPPAAAGPPAGGPAGGQASWRGCGRRGRSWAGAHVRPRGPPSTASPSRSAGTYPSRTPPCCGGTGVARPRPSARSAGTTTAR